MRIALSSVDVPFLRVQASSVCQMPTSGRDNIIGKLKREPVANATSDADKSDGMRRPVSHGTRYAPNVGRAQGTKKGDRRKKTKHACTKDMPEAHSEL